MPGQGYRCVCNKKVVVGKDFDAFVQHYIRLHNATGANAALIKRAAIFTVWQTLKNHPVELDKLPKRGASVGCYATEASFFLNVFHDPNCYRTNSSQSPAQYNTLMSLPVANAVAKALDTALAQVKSTFDSGAIYALPDEADMPEITSRRSGSIISGSTMELAARPLTAQRGKTTRTEVGYEESSADGSPTAAENTPLLVSGLNFEMPTRFQASWRDWLSSCLRLPSQRAICNIMMVITIVILLGLFLLTFFRILFPCSDTPTFNPIAPEGFSPNALAWEDCNQILRVAESLAPYVKEYPEITFENFFNLIGSNRFANSTLTQAGTALDQLRACNYPGEAGRLLQLPLSEASLSAIAKALRDLAATKGFH